MRLRPAQRLKFKKPFGLLIKDQDVTKERILQSVMSATKVISVGDATTRRLLEYGIVPNVAIVDGREQRHATIVPKYTAIEIRCKNPAGTITEGALRSIRTGLGKTHARLLVDGEEDLLVLPICSYAPLDSVVFYGQPFEGIVEVKITPEKKTEASRVMEELDNSKDRSGSDQRAKNHLASSVARKSLQSSS